jgi:hypothetical protein
MSSQSKFLSLTPIPFDSKGLWDNDIPGTDESPPDPMGARISHPVHLGEIVNGGGAS